MNVINDPSHLWQAMRAISSDIAIRMTIGDYPLQWYVSVPGIEIGGGLAPTSIAGYGDTPENAIRETWKQMTTLAPNRYLVKGADTDGHKHFRWNGFMWEDITAQTLPRTADQSAKGTERG
jgi:hypothetical protein